MAKRTREFLDNPKLPELNAPKYRRVAPKQDMDISSYTESTTASGTIPNTSNDGPFAHFNSQPYGQGNFRPT